MISDVERGFKALHCEMCVQNNSRKNRVSQNTCKKHNCFGFPVEDIMILDIFTESKKPYDYQGLQ